MVERLTTSEFDRRADLPDWRILLPYAEKPSSPSPPARTDATYQPL
jgi:hypothetical protein